jgi:hypothetical protein
MCCVSLLSFPFHGFYYFPSFLTPNLITVFGAYTKICISWWQYSCLYSKKWISEKNLCIFQDLLLRFIHRCYKYMLSVWDSFWPYWSREVNNTAMFVHKTSYLYAGQKTLSACLTLTHYGTGVYNMLQSPTKHNLEIRCMKLRVMHLKSIKKREWGNFLCH